MILSHPSVQRIEGLAWRNWRCKGPVPAYSPNLSPIENIFGRIRNVKRNQWSSHQMTWNKQNFVCATPFRSLILKNFIRKCLQELINALDCTHVPLKPNTVSKKLFQKKIFGLRIFCSMHCTLSVFSRTFWMTISWTCELKIEGKTWL